MEQTCVLRSSNIYLTIVYINFSERLFNEWFVTIPRVSIDLTSSYLIQPRESKTSPSLPPLMYLVTIPLTTVPSDSPQYAHYLATIFSEILTIPLLLNRLPLDHLPKFISRLSLSSLNVLDPHITSIIQSSNLESRIHLASTIFLFLSPQYKALSPPALSTYLRLSIFLFNEFPTNFVSASSRATKTTKPIDSYQSDSDDLPSIRVKVVAKFSATLPLPQVDDKKVDDKTMKRFQSVIAAPHLTSIISATRSNPTLFPHLVQYLFTLMTTWPSSREQILNIVLATTGGGLVREVYRELVRQSPLGKEENSEELLGKLGFYFISRSSNHLAHV
jgi:ubiquitin-protein ligase E3 C